MDIRDLLDVAESEHATKPHLTDQQVVTRLTEAYARFFAEEPIRFSPGQVLKHKMPSLSNRRFCETPCVFVKYLDNPMTEEDWLRAEDGARKSAVETTDCVIMFMAHDSRGDDPRPVQFAVPSCEYEPWNAGGN